MRGRIVSVAAAAALLATGGRPGLAQTPAAGDPVPVETFELPSLVFGNTRTIRVLPPAGYRDPSNRNRRYPVLYLNDGFAVFKATAWNAPETVRRLESEGRIRPIILVGIDNAATIENGSTDQRTREYLPYPDPTNEPSVPEPQGASYPDFLTREVMPAVASRYRVLSGPDETGLGGASLGGLAALYTVMHRPGVAGRLLIESTPLFLADFAALADAGAARSWPARVSIGIGTRETEDEALAKMAAPNMEALRSAIEKASPRSEVRLVVEPGAKHSSTAWRRRLGAALEYLWPASDPLGDRTAPRPPPSGSPGAESTASLARRVAGQGTPEERTRRLIEWSQSSLSWNSTDYVKRTPQEVLERRGGNCAELASVLEVLLQSIDLPTRWVAEVNIQPRSERRQADARARIAEMGNRASVFGLRHNDHRWLEVYDAASKTWFPADPAVGVTGIEAWEAARMGFGERPHSPIPAVAEITRDMIVPFAVMTLDPGTRQPAEDRSNYYLIEQFDRANGGRLSRLPDWRDWVAGVRRLSSEAREAFSGKGDLHRSEARIGALEQTYRRLAREAFSPGS